MKLKTLIASLLMLTSMAAQAQKVQVEAPVQTTRTEATSRQERNGKTWTANYEVFGNGANGTNQSGVSVGYFLDKDSIIQLEAGSGESTKMSWGLIFGEYEHAVGTAIGIHYKTFLGNSFYVKSGVDYRTFDYKYNHAFSTDQDKFQGTSWGVGLVIGNQWQWENFTVGCDWIGVSIPLTSTITSETLADSSDPYSQSNLNDKENQYMKTPYLQYSRFYMGMSF